MKSDSTPVDLKNVDSRNSKRTVVISKNKGGMPGQLSTMQPGGMGFANDLVGQPSTPQGRKNGTNMEQQNVSLSKQHTQLQPGAGSRLSQAQAMLQQSPQAPNISGGNTQIRVTSIPNTVKVTKNIKNVVYQQQLSKQHQFQQHKNDEISSAAFHGQTQHQQQPSSFVSSNNSRGFLNAKRRSNALESGYNGIGGLAANQNTGQSSQGSNQRGMIGGVRKGYQNTNVQPGQQQNGPSLNPDGSNQNQHQFNKTTSNMIFTSQQQMSANRGGGQENMKDGLIVVKLNQIQMNQEGNEQAQQIMKYHAQQQSVSGQDAGGQGQNQNQINQGSQRSNRTQSMNLKVGMNSQNYASVTLRPQSQNNRGQLNLIKAESENVQQKIVQGGLQTQNSSGQMIIAQPLLMNHNSTGTQQPSKLISSKHQQIQHIRQINNTSEINQNVAANSDNDSQLSNLSRQGGNQAGLNSPGNSKYFIKNQLRHYSKLIDAEDDGDCLADEEVNNQIQENNIIRPPGQGGMTLEDDVESMLSEQFNASNESMFRIRAGMIGTQALGGGGDSTYRGQEESVFGYDEDKGLISESDDGGWYTSDNGGRNAPKQGGGEDNDFDDISEHSSDDVSDSDAEINPDGQGSPTKKKKTKGEKQEKKKKKKKKAAEAAEAEAQAKAMMNNDTIRPKEEKKAPTYKQLQEDTKDQRKDNKNQAVKNQGKQQNDNKVKRKDTAPMKVEVQSKKSGISNNKSNLNASPSTITKGNKVDKNNQNKNQNKNQNQQNKEGKKDNSANNLVENAAAPKKAKKNGLKLQALNHALPKNLQEQHERFFESEFKVNPQFEYENAVYAQKFLEQFEEPDGKYLQIATDILDSFLKEYGSESAYLDAEGRKLDQEETHQYIKDYLTNLGVEEWISVNFQKNQVAPTSVTHDPKTGKCKMNIKLPCEYRLGRMIGVLDHEIGTHFLRKHNEKLQQWYKKRDKFEMKTCIATEEGLACTNQMVQTVKDGNCKPFLYRSALNYYAAYKAVNMSFVELFKDLEKYVDSPLGRWKFTLRVKRGLVDTSQSGGLYKDQVYLEGAVKVLSRRKNLNFKALLCGKISLDDYDRESIYSILNYEGQLLPTFMQDMDEYRRCLDIIAETNHVVDEIPNEPQNEIDENNKPIQSEELPAQKQQGIETPVVQIQNAIISLHPTETIQDTSLLEIEQPKEDPLKKQINPEIIKNVQTPQAVDRKASILVPFQEGVIEEAPTTIE